MEEHEKKIESYIAYEFRNIEKTDEYWRRWKKHMPTYQIYDDLIQGKTRRSILETIKRLVELVKIY